MSINAITNLIRKGNYNKINAKLAFYQWGEENGKKKMHWCSWKKMTQQKDREGLGFKELQSFNRVLLGKQVWRMVTTPNSLVSKVLKAKYYPHESIFRCKIKQNSSWIWQSLMGARDLVEKGTYRKIGNGKSTKIWEDKWIPGNS
ncbi:uncharacterized protein LOC113771370 [Coffea eugenioides]|uniref:Uncharacterized mitochondrial protein AtMg00310-like n=1 Tax=Coffea arabica TaxID=13443 RepID=A0A6P6S5J9_COFAR|nr:uncharacterized protein LOC113687257 [Coffea arabica]XP_027171756.1 uncharacterized protein LOC113771370 [Coffea eugenioides]